MRESARRIPLEHEAPAVHQDNPLKIAEAAAKMMWSRDRASQALGMALLEVRPSNIAGYRLYTGLGFDEIGIRKNYYPAARGREDAILLARDLTV